VLVAGDNKETYEAYCCYCGVAYVSYSCGVQAHSQGQHNNCAIARSQ
jgi:hypothetical protein